MAWLALAARRAASTAARRESPLLLDSTASSAARRAPLQPPPPVRFAAASDTHLLGRAHLLAGKAKHPPTLLDAQGLTGTAKQPQALLDAVAADPHLLGRAHLLAGKAKQQPLALLDAAATDLLAGKAKQPTPLIDDAVSSNVAKAIAAPTTALLGADVRQAGISKLAHGLSPKTGGVLFHLYGPRRASTGILFSAPTSGRIVCRRGMSSEASLTPEVKSALQKMEVDSLARDQEALDAFTAFRASTRKAYAMHDVNKANSTVAHARVGWRIVWGTLALGIVGLYYAIHLKSLWFVQFRIRVLSLLEDMMCELKEELELSLKEILTRELAQQSGMGPDKPGAFREILNDPDLMAALVDPEVLGALQDVMSNPANIAKHQSNSKVGPVIAKVMAKLSEESCDQ